MGALISILIVTFMGSVYSLTSRISASGLPTIHFADKPAHLRVRRAKGSDEVDEISIKALLETKCPSLFSEFKPLWWLPNGHFQTLYCVLGDFTKNDLMWYTRTYLKLADDGTIGLDFAPPDHAEKLKDDTPIVVVQHGLTGGSYEAYIRAILSRACASVDEGGLGYRAVVINFRGCAGVPVTSPLLYSAAHTNDTRRALMYIAKLYPNAPLLGLGFSLGSNVITRYLGEEGNASRLHAACVLACPWDLKANNDGLLSSFTGRHIYSRGMGGNLMRLLKRHLHVISQDPDHYVAQAAENALKLKNPTLEDFDQAFTRVGGGPPPNFPFPDSEAYYIWGSSHKIVSKITVPFLAINAADDPVVRHVPMDGEGNGLVVMELTTGGGHLGWFQQGPGYVDRWTTKPVLEWLKLVGDDVAYDPKPKGLPTYTDKDGFLREEGRPEIGVKVVEEGVIDANGGEGGVLQGL
ncbi:AB-hydrolase YheT [Pholiota conissans]|uniref:AB-hydrolase YheT n=1 Tax=Pholiota conissans TaxID=109636 RepID=A0A9P6D1F1_9AGAR|nr:AB-hydrolase YheT [Pholiota conissans]